MEHAINETRRELAYCHVSFEYEKYDGDARGMRFILGYIVGLERALAMLGGDVALVDEEIEAWWNGREAGKRAGTIHLAPWAIMVAVGRRADGLPRRVFTLRRRATAYVDRLTALVAFLTNRGIQISLTEWRD